MGKEYVAKSFKSGNSVAIRMPAALGVEPDREWTVVEEDGKLVITAKDRPKRKFNIEKVWGSATNLKPIDSDDRWFEERPLTWSGKSGSNG
jgi:antitoxin VapB